MGKAKGLSERRASFFMFGVQKVSRDILCNAMRLSLHCLICVHVHNELIIESPEDVSLTVICEYLGRTRYVVWGLCQMPMGMKQFLLKIVNRCLVGGGCLEVFFRQSQSFMFFLLGGCDSI